MAETTQNERAQDASDLAAAARSQGMEQLESAKGQLAEGAERVAAAVERTADELGGEGDGLSGFGHSVASLMRQLAGGLRERDVEEFARELAALARRNPGVFLAGSVALGFGIARFFKARAPHPGGRGDYGDPRDRGWQDSGRWQGAEESSVGRRQEFDTDESLDLSASTTPRAGGDAGGSASDSTPRSDDQAEQRETQQAEAAPHNGDAPQQAKPQDEERSQTKSRPSTKQAKRGGKS